MAQDRITLNRLRAAQLWHQEAIMLRQWAAETRGADESRALFALARDAAATAERFENPRRSTVTGRWL